MRIIKLSVILSCLFLISFTCLCGLAANPLDATVTINTATALTVTQASINFGSFAGFTSGPQTPVTLDVNAKCNKKAGYKVYIKGATVNFSSTDGDPATFPLSNMEFKPTSGSFTPMTTSDQQVHNATARTSAAGDDLDVEVRLNLLGSEAAGTYTNTVTFTIVAN